MLTVYLPRSIIVLSTYLVTLAVFQVLQTAVRHSTVVCALIEWEAESLWA